MPFPISFIRRFISTEATGGLVLMGAAAVALLLANSPIAPAYAAAFELEVGGLTILHWINDGLMALFFLLVGLEIKREVLSGQLDSWGKRILPGLAALGGMLLPAAIYLAFNGGLEGRPRGWAIPAATDIAFALGVLSLLGSRVPLSLRVFLTALAIIDDLGAVVIIALFYTSDLVAWALIGAIAAAGVLFALNAASASRLLLYLAVGAVLWFCTLKSGVHATVAGVILAFAIPMRRKAREHSPLLRLEHTLHPWVTFLIVPVFGLANAGVPFEGVTPASFLAPVPVGIALGLFVGKQVGIFGFAWLAIQLGRVPLPAGATWLQLYGVSILCGIGFTMSLFIGLLAFPSSEIHAATKLGVLAGSLMSAVAGVLVLLIAAAKTPR